jgi:hypothetical protein
VFIGLEDGTLEARDPSTMKVIKSIDLKSAIQAITSDDKSVYVSLENGAIYSLSLEDNLSESSKVMFKKANP